MPRALAIRHLTVDADARGPYRARLAARPASARAVGYHLWAFEQHDDAARVVEFIEAADASALQTALAQDALLSESLDFRAAPDAEAADWQRYVGIPHAS